MIQYNFIGEPYPSFDEQERAKQFWLDKLGPFKDEFDEKNGIVTFNYSYPEEDNRRIAFVLQNGELSDFIRRWNEYIRGLQNEHQ